MAILAPLNNPEWLDAFIDAGADQFYCGFYDDDWFATLGSYTDLNRMSGFGREANSMSFDDLLPVIERIAKCGKKAYVPFNAPTYTTRSLECQAWYYQHLRNYGASGVIVSLPEQVRLAKEMRLDPVISTMGAVYNSMIASYYEGLGVRRVILPRDLSLTEIESIVKETPSLEHEVFLMRNGCAFSDSYCLGMHGHGRGALCHELKTGKKWLFPSPEESADIDDLEESLLSEAFRETSDAYCENFHKYACGLCALWRLSRLDISAYKIVGRSDAPDALCADIQIANDNLRIALECKTEKEYFARMIRHPYANIVCADGLNCYFPEVRYASV